MLSKNEKGFTLVELMIVVVIIGVLASIAMPKFSKLIGKARSVEAYKILGQIIQVEEHYKFLNNDYLDFAETDLVVLALDFRLPNNPRFTYKFVGQGQVVGTATAIEIGDIDGNGAVNTDGLTLDTERIKGGVGDMYW